MEQTNTPQQPSRKKAILSLLVLLALTCVVVFIFSSHWAEISTALAQLSFWQVLLVLAIGLTYPLLEGIVCWLIIRCRLPGFTLRRGLDAAFVGIFGNVVGLGAGAMPMESYYLYHCGLPLGPGVGLMTLQYVFHKTTVLLYATVMLQLFFGHADAVIGDSQQAVVLIAGEQDAEIALVHAHGGIGQALIIKFVDGIRSVGDQLTQEDLLVGVDGVDHHVHQLFAFSLKFFLRHNTKPLLYSIQIRPLAKGAAMQKKQPMLHLLSTHIFRVLIYTDAGQKSRGFIKSSEMNWNKMPFVRCYKKFIKK